MIHQGKNWHSMKKKIGLYNVEVVFERGCCPCQVAVYVCTLRNGPVYTHFATTLPRALAVLQVLRTLKRKSKKTVVHALFNLRTKGDKP